MENGFQGKDGQKVPEMTPAIVQSISDRYIELFENITGEKFVKEDTSNIAERIEKERNGFLDKIRMDYPQQHIKPYNEEGKKTEQVERMFDNIAHAYDKLNHTLSLGIDRSWRRKAIAWLRPFHPQRMMDVATGTGDFAILACRKLQPAELIGTDISEGMMNVGREKVKKEGLSDKISFCPGGLYFTLFLPIMTLTLLPLPSVSATSKISTKGSPKCAVY